MQGAPENDAAAMECTAVAAELLGHFGAFLTHILEEYGRLNMMAERYQRLRQLQIDLERKKYKCVVGKDTLIQGVKQACELVQEYNELVQEHNDLQKELKHVSRNGDEAVLVSMATLFRALPPEEQEADELDRQTVVEVVDRVLNALRKANVRASYQPRYDYYNRLLAVYHHRSNVLHRVLAQLKAEYIGLLTNGS